MEAEQAYKKPKMDCDASNNVNNLETKDTTSSITKLKSEENVKLTVISDSSKSELYLNDLPNTKDNKRIQLNTTLNKDKSAKTTLPYKPAYLNSNEKSKRYKKRTKKFERIPYLVPNYFVAVQISNPEIHKAVSDVQKTMLSSNENLSESLIDVATLHITLFVIHISTEDELHIACSALDHCGAKLSKDLSENPLCLKFSGMSHFSNKVIFAQLVEDKDYQRFISAAEIIQKQFQDMGIVLPDDRSFTPHLTIAKLSKFYKTKGKSHIRSIEPKVYAPEVNRCFGEQFVSGLQLLSMEKRKDERRYYYSERETLFDFIPTESSDHSECCLLNPPKNQKDKPNSSGFSKEPSSSPTSSTPDSSNTSAFFQEVHLPKLKEPVDNFSNLKDVSYEDKGKNGNYFQGQVIKPLTFISGILLGEIYAFTFVEMFHHIVDIFSN